MSLTINEVYLYGGNVKQIGVLGYMDEKVSILVLPFSTLMMRTKDAQSLQPLEAGEFRTRWEESFRSLVDPIRAAEAVYAQGVSPLLVS